MRRESLEAAGSGQRSTLVSMHPQSRRLMDVSRCGNTAAFGGQAHQEFGLAQESCYFVSGCLCGSNRKMLAGN
ncbi:MAG TPA: hypothetical protein DDW52_16245 [Planctomycetaceae bacterium]|nr:hypothetical protein [Planctomycetaceae bacterium]